MNKNLLLIFIIFVSISVNAQMPSDSIISHWTFDGTTSDESDNHLDAIPVKKVKYGTDRFGRLNSAFITDTNKLTVPFSEKFNFKSNDKFSMSFWVYYPTSRGRYFGNMISKGNNQIKDYGITFYDAPGFFVEPTHTYFGKTLTSQSWYHFAYIYTGDSAKVYLNGKKITSILTAINPSSNGITMGDMTEFQPGGKLDDLVIFNRILSEMEIQNIYDENITEVKSKLNNEEQLNFIKVNDSYEFEFTSHKVITQVEVFDIAGEKIQSNTGNKLSKLESGLFMIFVTTENQVKSIKIMAN